MDDDLRDAFLTLNATLATLARQQAEQGEMLVAIVGLLTPDKDGEEGPSLQESFDRLAAAIRSATAAQAAALHGLADAMRNPSPQAVRPVGTGAGQAGQAAR